MDKRSGTFDVQVDTPEQSGQRFDYERQAWIDASGHYLRCGHVEPCSCYGRLHEGEPAAEEPAHEVFWNVWARIERADEKADEYQDVGEPVKLGSFDSLRLADKSLISFAGESAIVSPVEAARVFDYEAEERLIAEVCTRHLPDCDKVKGPTLEPNRLNGLADEDILYVVQWADVCAVAEANGIDPAKLDRHMVKAGIEAGCGSDLETIIESAIGA